MDHFFFFFFHLLPKLPFQVFSLANNLYFLLLFMYLFIFSESFVCLGGFKNYPTNACKKDLTKFVPL